MEIFCKDFAVGCNRGNRNIFIADKQEIVERFCNVRQIQTITDKRYTIVTDFFMFGKKSVCENVERPHGYPRQPVIAPLECKTDFLYKLHPVLFNRIL